MDNLRKCSICGSNATLCEMPTMIYPTFQVKCINNLCYNKTHIFLNSGDAVSVWNSISSGGMLLKILYEKYGNRFVDQEITLKNLIDEIRDSL